jgi:hypothetical protein
MLRQNWPAALGSHSKTWNEIVLKTEHTLESTFHLEARLNLSSILNQYAAYHMLVQSMWLLGLRNAMLAWPPSADEAGQAHC